MRGLFIAIICVCKLFATEAILSYQTKMQPDVIKLQNNLLGSLYLGFIKDNEQFLGKNGLVMLKKEQVDLLFIEPSILQTLGISIKDFDLYNLKLIKQTDNGYLISRASWYNVMPIEVQKELLK